MSFDVVQVVLRQRWFALAARGLDGVFRIHFEPSAPSALGVPWLRFPLFAGRHAGSRERRLAWNIMTGPRGEIPAAGDYPRVRALEIHSREFFRALRAAGLNPCSTYFDLRRERLLPRFSPPSGGSRKAAAAARSDRPRIRENTVLKCQMAAQHIPPAAENDPVHQVP